VIDDIVLVNAIELKGEPLGFSNAPPRVTVTLVVASATSDPVPKPLERKTTSRTWTPVVTDEVIVYVWRLAGLVVGRLTLIETSEPDEEARRKMIVADTADIGAPKSLDNAGHEMVTLGIAKVGVGVGCAALEPAPPHPTEMEAAARTAMATPSNLINTHLIA
jgi:hypothetical protein